MRGWRGLRICWCRLRRRLWGRLCRGRLRLEGWEEEEEEKEEERHFFLFSESPFYISSACLLACLLAAASQSKTSLIQGPPPIATTKKKKRNAFIPRGYHIATKVWSKREERKKKFQVAKPLLPASPWILISIITSQETRGYAQSPSGIDIQKKENPPPWILGL